MATSKNILILHGGGAAGQAAIRAAQFRGFNILVASERSIETKDEAIQFYNLNISNEKEVQSLATYLDDHQTRIDYLLTCPSSLFSLGGASVESWESVIDSHLKAPMLFCQIFGQRMLAHGVGRIIQLISNVAIDPYNPKHLTQLNLSEPFRNFILTAYLSAMAGLQSLSRHLAAQYEDKGVLINNLVYGPLKENEPENFIQSYEERIPLGRIMTINDLANALDLFLNPHSNYITGQSLIADGGVAIW